MVARLREFRRVHGHTIVSKRDDAELHRWAQSIRKNYIHPTTSLRVPCRNGHSSGKNETTAGTTSYEKTMPPYWTTEGTSARGGQRQLPEVKLKRLEEIDFTWDVQNALWDRRYRDLEAFVAKEGHCLVPFRHPTLGVWVRNQRREYRNLERGERSTLTRERLEKLHAVSFLFSRSRTESWESRYQSLVQYYRTHGNADVPENDVDHFSLGQWCMNQRTAYRRHCQGLPTALTPEKIGLLQDVGFSWNLRQKRWREKLGRVQAYFEHHGHVQIPLYDMENRDLRIWLTFQRYYYNLRRRMLKQQAEGEGAHVECPLTDERIAAIEESIPNFSWKVRDSNGPSRKDWANLFQAMRARGIRPGMRPKQHWFEGENPFTVNVKDVWTEEDLLELWNQESDDDLEFS